MSEQNNAASAPEDGASAIEAPGATYAEDAVSDRGEASGSASARPSSAGSVEFGVLRQVPMTVQVEVGRTTMTLGEILDELEVGASIRLDRHAGDPVEVYVNGALFARAEVVIVQDQIGVRIIEVVADRHDARPSGLR